MGLRSSHTGRVAALVVAIAAAATRSLASEEPRAVSQDEILAAMRLSQGYELTATANGPRLQAEVLVRLIAEAARSDPSRRPLLLGHREWFFAFLERTGLPRERAPLYVQLPFEIGQDLVADYRRERVIEQVLEGPDPLRAANVRIYWEKGAGKPEQYSYEDTVSEPKLRVTQDRVISYRLVDYGDRLWFAEIEGLRGRPTSGALGALFAMIGEATIVQSWSASAPDGTQIARGEGRKWWFDRTETITLSPSGRGDRGVPAGRPELRALERRLTQPLAIRFVPFVR
jgi:hypothetical protein